MTIPNEVKEDWNAVKGIFHLCFDSQERMDALKIEFMSTIPFRNKSLSKFSHQLCAKVSILTTTKQLQLNDIRICLMTNLHANLYNPIHRMLATAKDINSIFLILENFGSQKTAAFGYKQQLRKQVYYIDKTKPKANYKVFYSN